MSNEKDELINDKNGFGIKIITKNQDSSDDYDEEDEFAEEPLSCRNGTGKSAE